MFFLFSCFGQISSLNGEPEKGIAIEVGIYVPRNSRCCSQVLIVPFSFYVCNVSYMYVLCSHLQAVGLDSCESFQEETVSDQDGQYRLRGLQVC